MSMDYYDFMYALEDAFSALDNPEILGSLIVGWLVGGILASLYNLLVYILQSVGFYSVAKRRGIHHAWLGWIPVANMWVLGSIADQWRFVSKGKVTKNRRTLLVLQILIAVFFVVLFIGAVFLVVSAADAMMYGSDPSFEFMASAVVVLVAYFAMLVIAIILTVFQYIALYGYFASCNPNNAVAFIVLGILFSFLLPYFIFFGRKGDLGMPPRQPVYQQPPVFQPAPPPAGNTWQPPQPQAWQQPQGWQPPQPNPWLQQQNDMNEDVLVQTTPEESADVQPEAPENEAE